MLEDDKKKREEREKKKAEVRARLEASSVKANKKKGFMTPERKKKLRLLLRRKAAEELKRQQEAKAEERRKVIGERTGPKQNFDQMDERELTKLCQSYHKKIEELEGIKYDLEYNFSRIDLDIRELSMKLNDMRGKFIKPTLRKVPKFGVKIERMLLNARKEIGFTVNLKSVKRNQLFAEAGGDQEKAPEWSFRKDKEQAGDGQPTQEEPSSS